jgi:hypothetical protein
MIIRKELRGTVVQYFDTRKKKYTSQEFILDDCDAVAFLDDKNDEMDWSLAAKHGLLGPVSLPVALIQPT